MARRTVAWLTLILLFALGARAFVVQRSAGTPLYGDETAYDDIAAHVSRGLGFARGEGAEMRPTAARGPAYVVLLGAVYRVVGHRPMAVKAVQVVLDCLTVLLLFHMARRLFRRDDVALVAAFLSAAYPPFILHTPMLLTETFTIFLTTLAIALFLEHAVGRSRGALVAAAVATGLAALSKPVLVLLPAVFFLAAVRTMRPRLPLLRDLLVQWVLIGLVLSPWVIRNAVVFHAFVPGVTQGGVTFWGGTGPADGHVVGGLNEPWAPKGLEERLRPLSEAERDRWFYREGFRVIREHPARYARVLARKIPRLWFNLAKDEPPHLATAGLGAVGVDAGAAGKANLLLALANMIAMVLAGIGIARARPAPVAADLLLWLVLYFTAIHLAFFAVFRYSLPVYAYLIVFTAAGLVTLVRPHAPDAATTRPAG
jgi:4-amino-4-deoxy-L-arabinose transferase-like glycosyltransferase